MDGSAEDLRARISDGSLTEARVRMAAWCGHEGAAILVDVSPPADLKEWAEGLLEIEQEARARVALAAARLVLADGSEDEWQRPEKAVAAVAAWVEEPSEHNRLACKSAASAVEVIWNEWAEATAGAKHPIYQSTTYAAWTVSEEQPWNVVHAITGAAAGVGEEVVRREVCEVLVEWALG